MREVETAQVELVQEFSKEQFPLPLAPKDELSKVLVRFWWDNFDSLKENKTGSIHTCHRVAYTEESDETMERNMDIQIPRSKRRSIDCKELDLPKMKIVPHKPATLFNEIRDLTYDDTYATALVLIWKLQSQIHSANKVVSYHYVDWISSRLKKGGCSTTNITFLPVIRNPITEFSTIIECIYQSQKYANACNMRYTHITTDAGAATKFY